MKFKDFKIGQKIVTGFALLSVIGLIIGLTGIISMNNIGNSFHHVGDENMPAIQHLGAMQANLERVQKGYIRLLDNESDRDEREQILMEIQSNREAYKQAQGKFNEMKHSENEIPIINKLGKEIEIWRNFNIQKVDRMHSRLLDIDLLNPLLITRNLEKFMKDHYVLMVEVNEALDNRMTFEGGDDSKACNFGKWLPDFSTENAAINANLRDMRQYHNKFHDAVHEIKVNLNQGNINQARTYFQEEMKPAADQVFNYFSVINQEAQQAHKLFSEMSSAITGESAEHHNLVMENIKELVRINDVQAHEEIANGDQVFRSGNMLIILAIVIGLALASMLSYFITRTITSGINRGVSFAEDIAEGNLTSKIENEYAERKDEIGQLARALQHMVEQLRNIIGDVIGSADNITGASQEMSSTSQQMSQGASEQASSAEEISSSMEQMVANIQQNTDSAQQTEKIALQAAGGIRKGSESTNTTARSMKEIAAKVSIIGDIAYQTNILALNAAVEAARAGEHGQGFAVVAEEVRKLAERSQIAAEEIDELSGSGVEIAEQAGKQLEEIVPDIEKTAKLVQEIAAASMEQNSGADQINNAIQQLNQVIQQNAAASEEMASSSEELSGQAEQMREVVSYFQIGQGKKAVRKKKQAKNTSMKKSAPSARKEEKEYDEEPEEASANQGIDLHMGDNHSDEDFQRF
ncbi:methyl-accepting chemotaxis protein [Marinilabilia rubra]|uniref:Chemotaxis protein n=1 Tax=Marinilabilia rubra TaxID=2162893 RepID=A0A2U2BC81_9BACT|nr:methyl-accepting chemotaxis protein [Marinilabilia rubra]PWE00672.1 chemotaxis protein [Marinilabilia rubra]